MTTADLDRVLEINEANVPEVGALDRSRLAHLFGESAISLVSVHDSDDSDGSGGSDDSGDGIEGFCLVFAPGADYGSVNYRWFSEHHPGSMYLDRVAFDQRHVGRGLGSAMYAEVDRVIATDHTAATGFTLEVNVDPPNEASLAFHRKLGFTEVGRQMSKGIEVSLLRRDI